MKKVYILLLMIFLISVLTGCSENYISITEDESNAIAQYCSHLILKYDKNKTDDTRLLDYADYKKKIKAIEDAQKRITPIPEEIAEPEPTQEADITEAPVEQTEPSPVPTDIPVEDNSKQEPPVENTCTIAEALGQSNFTFDFKNLIVGDSYRMEGMTDTLYAKDNQNMAIVEFTARNITDSDQRLDLLDSDIDFILYDSNSGSCNYKISFYPNDLRTYNEIVKANSSVTLFVLFDIKADATPAKVKIIGNNTYTINFN